VKSENSCLEGRLEAKQRVKSRCFFIYQGIIFAYIATKAMEIKIKIDVPECLHAHPYGEVVARMDENIKQLLINQLKIMSAIDDLKTQASGLQTQVTDLQTTLDAEQAQIAELLNLNAQVVSGLNEQIAALQAQIANGATPEQLQEVADSLTAISAGIATVRTDLEGTVADTTPAP